LKLGLKLRLKLGLRLNDNQEGAAKSDAKLLTRLMQEACYLPDESDYLTQGKTVIGLRLGLRLGLRKTTKTPTRSTERQTEDGRYVHPK
jgi:hypothetical protein